MGLAGHGGAQELFSVVYPSRDVLHMAKKSGTLNLPISEHKAEVGEPFSEPHAVSQLQEGWVRVYGVPDKLRQAPLIKEFLRVVGKVVTIDELSLVRPDMGGIRGAPVQAKIWCRDPALIKGTYEVFRARNGFLMRVELETGGPLAPPAPPQSPPLVPPSNEDQDGGE